MPALVLAIRYEQPSAPVISDNLNSAPNTATFSTDGVAPSIGQSVVVVDPSGVAGTLFSGNVLSYDMDFDTNIVGMKAKDHLVYIIKAIDPIWILDAKLPYGSFLNTSATSVVKSLITQFAPTFTTINVADSLPAVTISLNRTQKLSAVLSAIAQLVGAVWKVDYNSDLHFNYE